MLGKVFEPQDFEAFLALLPDRIDGQALRHVIDVRRESFMTPECLALARRYRVATVFADAEKFRPLPTWRVTLPTHMPG